MEKLKSLFNKLPRLPTKVQAAMLTIFTLVVIVLIITLIAIYPVEFIAHAIFTGMFTVILFFIYTIYKEILCMLERRTK